MVTARLTNSTLIAPCGINCGVCRAHMRERNACPGCRADDAGKPKTRIYCKIKTCEKRVSRNIDCCFQCSEFPCQTLRHLDDRYRSNYGMSVIDNLLMIKTSGIRKFVASERQRWVCSTCGGALCVHEPQCPTCGRLR
jgi:hypothetical protein